MNYNSFLLSVGGSFSVLEAINPSSSTTALLLSTFSAIIVQIAKHWIETAYRKRKFRRLNIEK